MRISSLILFFLLLLTGDISYAQGIKDRIHFIVDTTFAAHPGATGIMVSTITSDGKVLNYAVGVSDKANRTRLVPDQPVLTASNTKPYVAAAILKLEEQKKLNITHPIQEYLTKATLDKLVADGYDTKKITLIHLLSHTSGIHDFVDDSYFDFVNQNKQHRWTRDEQIDRAMKIGDPLAQPGDTFKYADINFLLLTEIIEQKTGKPFYTAIRQLLDYKRLGLHATWFTTLEPKPSKAKPFAHQYAAKQGWDSYDLDPSWDLYGGGGIVATPADLALFFKGLFEGKVIRDKNELSKMYTDVPCKVKTNYCLGLRKLNIGGLTAYYHGGWWGTDVAYFPDLKTAISIIILERSEKIISADICKAIVEEVKKGR